jgi:signal peptidase II
LIENPNEPTEASSEPADEPIVNDGIESTDIPQAEIEEIHPEQPKVSLQKARQRTLKAVLLIVAILLADQAIKIWVKTYFTENQIRSIPLIGDWATLHFVENNGIAFGLELPGEAGKFLLTFFRILAAAFIFYYFLWRSAKKYVPMGLVYSWALVFAGATGNIIDSIFYGVWFRNINDYVGGLFHGKVVDMFYFPIYKGYYPKWVPFVGGDYTEFFRPVFNLADSSITVGILMIIFFYRKWLREL